MSIREEAENERQKLKNMTWRDRTWYVWEYYKFHLLGVILAIGVLSTIGTMIYRQTFTTRLSVAIINDRSGGAGSSAQLESDLRKYLGCGKKDLIEINEGLMVDFNEESTSQYGYATLAKISALAASESLDVVIGDQSAIDHYETISAYQSLEELLSPELYARVKDHIYQARDGEGTPTPVALSLEDTAVAAGLSSARFSTSFKSETGVTFTDYLLKLRMEKAKELMRDPNRKIYEIAMMTGYSNIPYFSTAFKKYTGCPPSEYKETRQGFSGHTRDSVID